MLSTEVIGQEKVLAALGGLERQVRDQRRALDAVLDKVFIPAVSEQFATEGHGGWPGNSKQYARRKRAVYGDKPILQAAGTLVRAVTEDNAPHQIRDVRPDGLEYGADLGYAMVHQEPSLESGIPQRKIFDLTPDVVDRIGDKVREVNREEASDLGFEVIR